MTSTRGINDEEFMEYKETQGELSYEQKKKKNRKKNF